MRVFGVDVEVVRGAAPTGAPPDARPVSGAVVVLDLRRADGSPYLTVTRSAAGWWLDAPAFGRHLVAPDGRRVTVGAAEPDGDRLLVAQSLPTAAALQGRDLFHAAAVRTPAGVVALSGPSGSGKSTLMRGLVARGAGVPFAGDVLAVAGDGDVPTAFAGPVAPADPASVPATDRAPLAMLVLLDRVAAPGPLTVVDAPVAEVLAAGFAPHVDGPARLLTRLDVSGALVRGHRVRRLLIPPGATVGATLDALEALLRAPPAGTTAAQ